MRSRLPMLVGVALVAALAAGAFGLWDAFLRPVPAAVSLPGAAAGVGAATSSGAAAAPGTSPVPGSPASPSGSTRPGSATAASSDLDGTWTVDPSIGSFSDFSGSFVGYRVKEELANVGAATAAGRTPDVSGTLTLEGTTLRSVEITADLTTLKSDNNMRDGQLRRQGLETGTYPTASFVLTEPLTLDAIPVEGETISVTATGDLSLHGVTKSVAVPLQAQLNGEVITVIGSLEIAFADFGMTPPQSMLVLGIDDHGVMEFQLKFTRS